MTRIWTSSDHHFRHRNILTFTTGYDGDKDSGELIRGKIFKDIDEHDNKIVEFHNELVRPEDHVYLLGDVAINKGGLEFVKRLNGHKRLVRGNHDIFEDRLYYEAGIEKIFGVRVWPKHNIIMSHIPLHPDSISSRGWTNVHGHLHQNRVMLSGFEYNGDLLDAPDIRYRCVSLEHTNYRPILLME